MLVQKFMQSPVTSITPLTTVRAAATLMKALDIGCLAICENDRPVGILTDRDIVIRWVPDADQDAPVASIMSADVQVCRSDHTITQAANQMGDIRLHRLLVLDGDDRLVGILTLGDIARDASEELAGQTLGEIVEPR